MRSGIFLLVVLLALGALAALLWWRFKGSGQAAPAPTVLPATRNHHSLRSFHYAPAAAQKAAATAGAVLAQLLPEEDLELEAQAPDLPDEEPVTEMAAHDNPELAEQQAAEDEAPRPASIRHAAGAVASLLDALDTTTAAEPEPIAKATEPASETDEEPDPALYFNPLTAPAPTANDQANRAAEIALRQQRRARMNTNAAAQRTALSGLFPGAGSPVPTTQPS